MKAYSLISKTIFTILLVAGLLFTQTAQAATTKQIPQYNITWTFDKEYEAGQFANGDNWVVGPVVIESITPEYIKEYRTGNKTCTVSNITNCTENRGEYGEAKKYCNQNNLCEYEFERNGWEVNPSSHKYQGFDSRLHNFNSSLIPHLPYLAQPGESIVKSASSTIVIGKTLRGFGGASGSMALDEAAVLTVLAEAPTDEGKTVFRPPYFGKEKAVYSTRSLNLSLLPAYEYPKDAAVPNFVEFEKQIILNGPQLDHIQSFQGDYLHPKNNMPNDGGAIARRNNMAALRLMFNDTVSETSAKMDLLIRYIQQGIDLYQMGKTGQTWQNGGQVSPGRKLPITFAAVLFENEEMKSFVRNAGTFQFLENADFNYREKAKTVLWSQVLNPSFFTDKNYWLDMTNTSVSAKTAPDPYGYIDGSMVPGDNYLSSSEAQNAKGVTLILRLMPALRETWNDQEIVAFAERWVSQGVWTQPDPCAPARGICKAGTANPGNPCTTANVFQTCWNGNINDFLNYTFSNGQTVSKITLMCEYSWDGYGKDYGEQPGCPGECIKDTDPSDGIGRYPWLHGAFKDGGGLRLPSWGETMWNNSTSSIFYGDVDGNGIVNIVDAALAAKLAVNLTDDKIKNADPANVDETPGVQINDAALIARKAVGLLIGKFPREGSN